LADEWPQARLLCNPSFLIKLELLPGKEWQYVRTACIVWLYRSSFLTALSVLRSPRLNQHRQTLRISISYFSYRYLTHVDNFTGDSLLIPSSFLVYVTCLSENIKRGLKYFKNLDLNLGFEIIRMLVMKSSIFMDIANYAMLYPRRQTSRFIFHTVGLQDHILTIVPKSMGICI
jgi:hypothetical protein